MKFESIKLQFGSNPLHIGRGRDELDKTELIYHSDSLKSAIYSIGVEMFREWQDPDYFFQGFTISSCFPYAGHEFFIPRPNIRKKIIIKECDDDLQAKKVKSIEYLSKAVFEEFINRGLEDIVLSEANLTSDLGFICENEETCVIMKDGISKRISFFKTEVQQRVAVPSIDTEDESRPFYIDRIYFEEGCGFYFLAGFSDGKIRKQVFTALKVLGENGIGTDRTVGNGLFSFNPDEDVSDFIFNITSQSGFFLPLGLYLPTPSEMASIDLRKSSWSLLKRGGYMGGSSVDGFKHLLKKSIYMFGVGSVFSTDTTLIGKYEDLKPDWNLPMHPVWRCGMPLFLKI